MDQSLVQSAHAKPVAITIPANNAAAKTLAGLIAAADLPDRRRIIGARLYKYQAGGTTDRAAVDLAAAVTGTPADLVAPLVRVPAGEDFELPASRWIFDLYAHSTDTNAVPAVLILFLIPGQDALPS